MFCAVALTTRFQQQEGGFPLGNSCGMSWSCLFVPSEKECFGWSCDCMHCGKCKPRRVIFSHLTFSPGLTSILYFHACIATENLSPWYWNPHGCCHMLGLESRKGGQEGWAIKRGRGWGRVGEDSVNSFALLWAQSAEIHGSTQTLGTQVNETQEPL